MTLPEGLEDGSRRRPAHLASVAPAPAATSANWGHVAWAPPQDRPEDAPRRIDVAAVWRIGVKHAGIIGLSLATALALGAAVTLLTRPIYSARTTLQIDREAEKVVSADEQTPLDNYSDEFFQTQYGLLRSRALAARVAESQGLTADDGFIRTMTARAPVAGGKPLTAEERRQAVIDLLRAHESVTPERGSRLVAVAFGSPEPALSARIANAFAENFIASALDRRFESSSYARDFLEKRLAQVKARLEQSERDLVAYAASQQIIQLPAAGQPNQAEAGPSLAAANLEAFNTALATARADRIKAEQKWRQAQASGGVGLSDILQSPTIQVLSQEHAKLVAEYQDKLRIFKPDYPDLVQLKARVDETERQLAQEAGTIRQSLQAQYEATLANERALASQVDALKSAVLDLRGRSIRYTILQREVDTNRTLYDGLLQRYKEVGVAGGVAANNISIVDRAETPLTPSEPRPLLNMILAALVGVASGVGLAYLREAFDQAIRSPADVEADLPLLGAIPFLRSVLDPTAALADARSPMAEAYHALRSALQFSTPDGLPKTLMITSPTPGGGKTTTAFAVAQYVARLGFRVLLVDADLRNPSLRGLMGLEGGVGLTSLLTGAAALKDAVQPTALVNLFVVTAGPPAPNPAELLAGSRLPMLIAEGGAVFDMMVFDGPPTMGLADAPMLGAAVAGCLIVVEAGRTTRSQLRQSLRRMSMAGAHILGAVLTKYRARRDPYGYGYGYAYAAAYGRPDGGGRALVGPRGVAGVVARARRLIAR
ncbi:MAG TPA: polysaccharide biosynthesis tyrosine autokinase [Caulobacteraceae bacterium]|nr:polysaccharide biosynthesis tyrosine autokinase [Caulobacteraceae bacterium]